MTPLDAADWLARYWRASYRILTEDYGLSPAAAIHRLFWQSVGVQQGA